MHDNRSREIRTSLAVSVLLMLVAAFLPTRAAAQLPRDLLEEALDQPLERLEIENAPIRDALSKIEQTSGLHFALDDAVVDLMPYGERTRVSIVIRDMSVRKGLGRVLEGLGLQMFVEQGAVVLVPAPVLDRIGRRMTIEEVNLLERLASAPWPVEEGAFQVEFRIDPEQKPAAALARAVRQVQGGNALQQLESATAALGWVWRADGTRIVFESCRDDIRRRLDYPLDLTYQREPLDRLLTDLGARVGVLMKFEPGALQKVSARDRAVDLIQRGVSVRQILERICGNTGLRYEIDDEGVRILAPLNATGGPTASTIQQWIRVELEIRPGVKMDVFLRQDQLPAHLRKEVEEKLAEVLKQP